MSLSTLVFDQFSEQHFNDPYPTYRRLRDEAPLYYSDQYNFYALSRHSDVAAAFKDFGPGPTAASSGLRSGTTSGPSVAVARYNRQTGTYMGPDGHLYRQADLVSADEQGSRNWKDLLPTA